MARKVWSLHAAAFGVQLIILLISSRARLVESAFSLITNRDIQTMPPSPRKQTAQTLHRFFILRHGETDANAFGVIQGSSDISRLTERGRTQAASVGSEVFGEAQPHIMAPIDAIYVSPLTRAQETLKILRQHSVTGMLPSTETELNDLREIDMYSWEGRNVKDIEATDVETFEAWKEGDAKSIVVDGKLPIIETWKRAETVWNTIRQKQSSAKATDTADTSATSTDLQEKEQSTLLVCHGTLGQALLCTAFGWDETHFRRHEFPNCGLVEILWKSDKDVATSWRWHYPERTERLHPLVDTTLA